MKGQKIKLAVDAVVFGYDKEQLFILLIKQKFGPLKNRWALPGGFVKNGEGLRLAVERELREETGIELNYLEQLATFGDDTERDPRAQVVSVAYYGLVNSSRFVLHAGSDAEKTQWFPIHEVPELAFDHSLILQSALDRLKAKLRYQAIGFDLLDKEFPFSDLEKLYMTILERKIDRRNFRKKMLSLGFLTETNKQAPKTNGRPGKLFRFNQKKYRDLRKKGFHFELKFA